MIKIIFESHGTTFDNENHFKELLIVLKKDGVLYINTITDIPIWAGFIFYFEWRKRLPIKLKQANRITFIAFGLWLFSSIFFGWQIDLSV